MHEPYALRQQRLAREKAVYRYTTALESGDLETLAAVLQQAEQDQLLEQMILEVHDVYQNEDRTAVDPEEVVAVQDLLLTLPSSQKVTQKETSNEASLQSNVPLLPHGQKGTRERMPPDRQTHPRLSTPLQQDEPLSVHPSTHIHRLRTLTQTLAAVLVVAALLGSFLVLFASRHPGPAGSSGTWKMVSSPHPGIASYLSGVTAISASDVWAVGESYSPHMGHQSLIEHWNGTRWSVFPSPSLVADNSLHEVAAVSASGVWAVGDSTSTSGVRQTLIEHWNGSRWSVFPSPNVGGSLEGVAVVSASDVWAVGSSYNQTLIEHWNGARWSVVKSPNPKLPWNQNHLSGVAVVSASDVWAVGDSYSSTSYWTQTLIEHWNGSKWSIVPSPTNPGAVSSELSGVTALSASDVWAVGSVIEHWNGTNWSTVMSPNVGGFFYRVAAVSARNIWAVGLYGGQYTPQTLIEHYS